MEGRAGQSVEGCCALPSPRQVGCDHSPGRETGSELRATREYKYRLQFGDCRLPRGHTDNWNCNRSPRCQEDRAQSSYHAANLEKTRRNTVGVRCASFVL